MLSKEEVTAILGESYAKKNNKFISPFGIQNKIPIQSKAYILNKIDTKIAQAQQNREIWKFHNYYFRHSIVVVVAVFK